jgi:hypothetical protein
MQDMDKPKLSYLMEAVLDAERVAEMVQDDALKPIAFKQALICILGQHRNRVEIAIRKSRTEGINHPESGEKLDAS